MRADENERIEKNTWFVFNFYDKPTNWRATGNPAGSEHRQVRDSAHLIGSIYNQIAPLIPEDGDEKVTNIGIQISFLRGLTGHNGPNYL